MNPSGPPPCAFSEPRVDAKKDKSLPRSPTSRPRSPRPASQAARTPNQQTSETSSNKSVSPVALEQRFHYAASAAGLTPVGVAGGASGGSSSTRRTQGLPPLRQDNLSSPLASSKEIILFPRSRGIVGLAPAADLVGSDATPYYSTTQSITSATPPAASSSGVPPHSSLAKQLSGSFNGFSPEGGASLPAMHPLHAPSLSGSKSNLQSHAGGDAVGGDGTCVSQTKVAATGTRRSAAPAAGNLSHHGQFSSRFSLKVMAHDSDASASGAGPRPIRGSEASMEREGSSVSLATRSEAFSHHLDPPSPREGDIDPHDSNDGRYTRDVYWTTNGPFPPGSDAGWSRRGEAQGVTSICDRLSGMFGSREKPTNPELTDSLLSPRNNEREGRTETRYGPIYNGSDGGAARSLTNNVAQSSETHYDSMPHHTASPPYQNLVGAAFVLPNGVYNIARMWDFRERCRDLWMRDKFHALLDLNMGCLLPSLFVTYVVWAVLLALLLATVSDFDATRCLGGHADSLIDFYLFTIETMFTIGFGSPRFPSCPAANGMVSVIVISTTLLNAFVIGLTFAKFSSSTRRRWAVVFSSQLVAASMSRGHKSAILHVTQPSRPHETAGVGMGSWSDENVDDAEAQPSGSAETKSRPATERTSKRSLALGDEKGTCDSTREKNLFLSSIAIQARHRNRKSRLGHFNIAGGAFRESLNISTKHAHRADGSTTALLKFIGQNPSTHTLYPLPDFPPAASHSSFDQHSYAGVPRDKDCSQSEDFTVSFRLINLTSQSFFNAKLNLFTLTHREGAIDISQVNDFFTDVPLEFLQLPMTVSIDSRQIISPVASPRLTMETVKASGKSLELLALLSFTDNRTSRTIEIRKSWCLSDMVVEARFKDILSRTAAGTYAVDVENLDTTVPLMGEP